MKTLTTGMLFLVLVYYHIMEVNAEYQNICIKFKWSYTGFIMSFYQSLFIKNKQIFNNGLHRFHKVLFKEFLTEINSNKQTKFKKANNHRQTDKGQKKKNQRDKQ